MLLATPGLIDRWVWVPVRGLLIRHCGVRGAAVLEEVVYAAAAAPVGLPPSGDGAAAAGRRVIWAMPRYGSAPSLPGLPLDRPLADMRSGRPRSLLEERVQDQPNRYSQAAQLAAANLQLACREAQVHSFY